MCNKKRIPGKAKVRRTHSESLNTVQCNPIDCREAAIHQNQSNMDYWITNYIPLHKIYIAN